MQKFLKIDVIKSIWHNLFNLQTETFSIPLSSDKDIYDPVHLTTITARAMGRKIEAITFDSLGDSGHMQFPSGAGYYSGQNHAYVSINSSQDGQTKNLLVSSHSLANVIKALERIKKGELPGRLPDFWRPDYGYRIPGSISCAYGSEPILQCECVHREEPDWWGPAM